MTRSNRSKSSKSSKEKREKKEKSPAAQIEVDEDGFGVDDRLSRLPDTVLINILLKLRRMDIYNLSTVNDRLRKITTEKTLDSVKWQGLELRIFPTTNGYAFTLNIYELRANPWKRPCEFSDKVAQYEYHCTRDEKGALVETRRMFLDGERGDRVEWTENRHDWPIPDEYYVALSQLLRHHSVENLILDGVPYTVDFFVKLREVFIDQLVNEVHCVGTGGQSITEEIRHSIAQLVKNMQSVTLYARECSQVASIINESFLRDASADMPGRNLNLNAYDGDVVAHQFRLNHDMIPMIVAYRNFNVHSMIVDASSVMRMCTTFMDSCEGVSKIISKRWSFGITGSIADSITLQLRGTDYELTWKSVGDYGEIARLHYFIRKNGLVADVSTKEHRANGRTVMRSACVRISSCEESRLKPVSRYSDQDDE